ncbi:type B 50S ribosomal protein L31 [Patescibacteria group bacterium]|nr:type B 50S ribosomal protein L31 [Patescibacteria group bacterium]MBU1702786.1 type B 50S ribosomal protein L31 [Patescibacteria group bacterium]MBU1954245.1 type B 50S ribosomal protein L31 [Patescibacteria group bacterium]
MKANIHPKLNPVVFIDTSTGAEFITTSTLTSEEKKKIRGVEHFVIKVEISSQSHPFYTGKRKLVDTAGRVDKFLARAKKAQEIQGKKVKLVDEELDEILQEHEEMAPLAEKSEVEIAPIEKKTVKVKAPKPTKKAAAPKPKKPATKAKAPASKPKTAEKKAAK